MSLKFTFGGGASNQHDHGSESPGIPLPFNVTPATSLSSSSVLELHVTRVGDALVCEGVSGDGVTYGRSQKSLVDGELSTLAATLRSVLARTGAELPEPLITSVTAVVLKSIGGDTDDAAVLRALDLEVDESADQPSTVSEALQARTGLNMGTPIRFAAAESPPQ